jgi:uncharacterized membrane protein
MSILGILKDSLTISKNNPLIFLPMLVFLIIVALLSLIFVGSMAPDFAKLLEQGAASTDVGAIIGGAVGGSLLIMLISMIVGLLAHGMTVAMADEARKNGKTSLQSGWKAVTENITPLAITAVLTALIISVGMVLLVLPGVIALFLLLFAVIAVMVDKEGATNALGKSVRTVTANLGTTFILFLILIALGVLVSILTSVLALLPILGIVIDVALTTFFSAYITVYLVVAYDNLEVKPKKAPEPTV